MISHEIISGVGQSFTRKNNQNPYPLIGLDEIRQLVDEPQSVAKEKARWALPSTFHSRTHAEQQKHGSYLYLWADLDNVYRPIEDIRDVIESFINSDYEIYTTSSATRDNQKARVLIPLANPLSPPEWHQHQVILNQLICEHEITPDGCNKQYGQFFYLPNRGEFYAHYSRRADKYFNPTIQWNHQINIKLTEKTDEYRRLQMNTEITNVVVIDEIDYSKLPKDCSPEKEGERNRKLFTFARYLKKRYPEADFTLLRPIVLGWHNHFKDVIGTKCFAENWSTFRRGYRDIKVPYGEGIESIINAIDTNVAIPEKFINLGYTSKREFKLLLIIRQLQLIQLDEPFFLACRKAGEFIKYNHYSSSQIIDSFVSDGILEIVKENTIDEARRYKYLWKDF
jgi:hypothetical protein